MYNAALRYGWKYSSGCCEHGNQNLNSSKEQRCSSQTEQKVNVRFVFRVWPLSLTSCSKLNVVHTKVQKLSLVWSIQAAALKSTHTGTFMSLNNRNMKEYSYSGCQTGMWSLHILKLKPFSDFINSDVINMCQSDSGSSEVLLAARHH